MRSEYEITWATALPQGYDAPPHESTLVWVDGRYVLCAADIPTLIRGRGEIGIVPTLSTMIVGGPGCPGFEIWVPWRAGNALEILVISALRRLEWVRLKRKPKVLWENETPYELRWPKLGGEGRGWKPQAPPPAWSCVPVSSTLLDRSFHPKCYAGELSSTMNIFSLPIRSFHTCYCHLWAHALSCHNNQKSIGGLWSKKHLPSVLLRP